MDAIELIANMTYWEAFVAGLPAFLLITVVAVVIYRYGPKEK